MRSVLCILVKSVPKTREIAVLGLQKESSFATREMRVLSLGNMRVGFVKLVQFDESAASDSRVARHR